MPDPREGLPSPAEIRSVARDLLREALRSELGGPSSSPRSGARELVNESQILAAREKGGVLVVPEGALVTPLARDAAERFGVEIRYGSGPAAVPEVADPDAPGLSPETDGGTVALGSDHGGFKLKTMLVAHLKARGFPVVDVGPTSDAACDYPDLAARVGKAIALGEAAWGVFVDGAGIGGAMVLNKMPGVFAATCHDEKAAKNARGHNDANTLCLGSGWVDEAKARAVVDAFLGTGFEGGRHSRRVRKIHAVERAFLPGGRS